MAVKVYLNDNEIQVKYGFPITDILQDNLDSVLITVPQTREEIKVFDEVMIDLDGNIKYFYVSLVKQNIVAFNPEIYNYTLTLTSPALELQRIILPNRSITQPFTYSKSIYDVLSQYVEVYAGGYTFTQAFIDRFSGIQAPEMKWEQPTLYEVFNDLLETDGCIVTMKDFNTIHFLDLSVRYDEIDTDTINDIQTEQSAEDYASDLDIDAKNVVYDTTNHVSYAKIALKTEGTLLTVDNAKLILPKKIYALESFGFYHTYYDSEDDRFYTTELDLTDYLVEKTVYDNYKSSNSLGLVTGNYKRNALYFVEGENTVEGFGYNEDSFLGISTYRALTNIVRNEIAEQGLDRTFTNSDILDALFTISYTTIEDIRFIQRKENSNYLGSLVNNQEVSSVDMKSFSNKNQELANRLANQSKNISFKQFTNYNDIPKLGDYYNDYVLTSREIFCYYDYYIVKGLLTENYVMQDITEALKQNKRYTSISTESFQSHHVRIFEVEITHERKINYEKFEYYLNNFAKGGYNIDLAEVDIYKSDGNLKLAMPVSVHSKKNSVLVNFEMVDNYSAGTAAESESVFGGEAISMVDIPYVDQNGEFTEIEIKLHYLASGQYRVPTTVIDGLSEVERVRNLPAVDDDFHFNTEAFHATKAKRYKDNREQTKETIEFIFREDGVFIGDAFINDNALTYLGSEKTLEVRYSETETYSKYDKNVAKGSYLSGVVRNDNEIYADIDFAIWQTLNIASWCVCDNKGNVYFATNSNQAVIYITFKEIIIPIELGESIFQLEANLSYHRSKDIGADLTADFGLLADMAYHRSKDIGFDLLPIFGLNADLDYHRSKDIGYDLLASFGLSASMTYTAIKPIHLNFDLTAQFGLVANMTYTVYNPHVEWVSGGNFPIGSPVCSVLEDEGNVKCDILGTTCAWVFDGGNYVSATDVSVNAGVPCDRASFKTECSLFGGNWLCQDYTSDTVNIYGNCMRCEIVYD